MSGLSREEYCRMLEAARSQGKEKEYLMIKLFVATGITVKDLQSLTAEQVRKGKIKITYREKVRTVQIPDCLRDEILDYAVRSDRTEGLLFPRKDGQPMAASYISNSIRRLQEAAGIAEEECHLQNLQKLYRKSGRQSAKLMKAEQSRVGWNPPEET